MATVLSLCRCPLPSPSPSSPVLSPSTIHNNFRPLKAKKRTLALGPKSLSSPVAGTYHALPPAIQTFWQWISGLGVVSDKNPVGPGVVPEGLGLVARRDIARNEVVLEVPKRLWINPEAVSASEIGSVCAGLKPWISVAVFLIREKLRADSPWRYYIDILPESTNSTIFWCV